MRFRRLFAAAACTLALSSFVADARAIELVTQEEAMLPDDPLGVPRGVTRAPDILLISPAANAGLVRSPLALKILFEAHGGSQIDPDSIVVTYHKIPSIDMTQRIRSFIRPKGIEIPVAELPVGKHLIRIDVKDNAGRDAAKLLTISVKK
jgi:hypothetical protein